MLVRRRRQALQEATSSLGKPHKIVYQGYCIHRSVLKCVLFSQFQQNDREWNHGGITKNDFKEC
jgi:hypothetical protein